jgi:hypothetical protein
VNVPTLYVIGEADYESHETLRFRIERGERSRSELLRGDFPAAPVAASRQLGSKPVDYTDMSLCVVSAAFREAVMRHGLTGVVFAPLAVDGDERKWFLLGVTGRCGPFDYSRSEHFEKVIQRIRGGGESRTPYLRGFQVDPASVSGDDFLLPPARDQVIVTQRVVDSLAPAELTNLSFIPIDRYEVAERNVLKAAGSG